MLKITHNVYDRDNYVNGARSDAGEEVDADHVKRFLEARDFFDGLSEPFNVPRETHTKRPGGVIVVVRHDPEGAEHTTIFTPHPHTRKGSS